MHESGGECFRCLSVLTVQVFQFTLDKLLGECEKGDAWVAWGYMGLHGVAWFKGLELKMLGVRVE